MQDPGRANSEARPLEQNQEHPELHPTLVPGGRKVKGHGSSRGTGTLPAACAAGLQQPTWRTGLRKLPKPPEEGLESSLAS